MDIRIYKNCPECLGDAVRCGCDALTFPEQQQLLDEIGRQFRDVNHALAVIAAEDTLPHSLLWQGCLEYLMANAPEELRENIRVRFEECFGIQAAYRGEDGRRLYGIDQVAEALGLTVEEAMQRAEALLGPKDFQRHSDASRVQ